MTVGEAWLLALLMSFFPQSAPDNLGTSSESVGAAQSAQTHGGPARPVFSEVSRARPEIADSTVARIDTGMPPLNHSGVDWWLVIPTWLLAVFTFGLFLYTARLWSATATLVREAGENAERQLRAYVFEELVASHAPVAQDHTPAFQFTFKNCGNTPAENVSICIGRRLAASTNPMLPDLKHTDRGSVFSLPQSATRPLTLPSERLPQATQDVIAEGKDLYIYGDVTYVDVFGKRCVVELRYRWRFGPSVLELCESGNSARYGLPPGRRPEATG